SHTNGELVMRKQLSGATRLAIGLALSALTVGACAPRQVEVRTAPTQATSVSLQVNNNLETAVNVYAVFDSVETFLSQVPGRSSQSVPVQGIATGTTVSFKAVTIDGTRRFTRDRVTLSGTYTFQIP